MGQQLSILTKALMATCAILLFWLVWVVNDYDKLSDKFDKKANELAANQFILSTVLELSVTFNEISRNNLRERDAAAVASETVKTIIKTVIVDDKCAAIDAPRDATIELHNHANRIRSNAISAHSSSFTQ
ncbi:hypothetical protein ABQD47_00080 [Providencia rettgeri]|uniref:hypothetical protein n=2 Tax=Providencia rettgeri TaxID=587 RepID=UPI0009083A0F|nr:hypothetical protein [Providencia rettgeri]APC12965.1 hypothetical protein RB151_033070 [Providencia rettgeri]QPE16052.1 hypothetical protein IMQ36_12745 [Providencia rettgeri]